MDCDRNCDGCTKRNCPGDKKVKHWLIELIRISDGYVSCIFVHGNKCTKGTETQIIVDNKSYELGKIVSSIQEVVPADPSSGFLFYFKGHMDQVDKMFI